MTHSPANARAFPLDRRAIGLRRGVWHRAEARPRSHCRYRTHTDRPPCALPSSSGPIGRIWSWGSNLPVSTSDSNRQSIQRAVVGPGADGNAVSSRKILGRRHVDRRGPGGEHARRLELIGTPAASPNKCPKMPPRMISGVIMLMILSLRPCGIGGRVVCLIASSIRSILFVCHELITRRDDHWMRTVPAMCGLLIRHNSRRPWQPSVLPFVRV